MQGAALAGADPGLVDSRSKIPDRRKPGDPDDEFTRWDEAANAWDDSGRRDTMLLKGNTLKQAEAWYEKARGREPKPTVLHREFLESSKAFKKKRVFKVAAIVGALAGAVGLGGLVAKLLVGDAPEGDDDEEGKDKTSEVETYEGETEIYEVANPLASDAILLAETNPRGAVLQAAVALHLVAASAEGLAAVPNSDPERALRTTLGKTRGQALVGTGNAGSGKPVGTVAISRDGGKAIATSGEDAWMWNLSGTKLQPTRLPGHQSEIQVAAVSPDGRWLVTAAQDKTVRLWNLGVDDPSTDVRALREHKGAVVAVDFSTDGRWMISASIDDAPRIWDLHAADPTRATGVLSGGHTGLITDVAISADGNTAFTSSDDMSAKIWKLEGGKLVGRPKSVGAHEGPVTSIGISPNGRWLITGSQDTTARMWDLAAPVPGRTNIVLAGHKGPIHRIAVTADSKLVVTASTDKTMRIWELGAKDPSVTGVKFESDAEINQLAIDPNSNWILTTSKDGKVTAWNLTTHKREVDKIEMTGHTADARSLAVSGDGRWLISGSADGSAFVWDYQSHVPPANAGYFVARAHQGPVQSAAVSQDGRRFLTVGADKLAWLWGFEDSGRARPMVALLGHEGSVNAVALSTDGRWGASAGQDKSVRVWDLVKSNPNESVQKLEGHADEITKLAFSPDGSLLFSASTDKTVRAWKSADWSNTVLAGHTDEVVTLAVAPNGRWLVSADLAGQLRVWDLEAPLGTAKQQEVAHEAEIWTLVFSPDSKWMVSGSSDRNARLWSVDKDGLVAGAVLRGHTDQITSASFSANGKWLVTGSRDSSLRLWDLASAHPEEGARMFELPDKTSVEHVAFTPDSKRLVIGGNDGGVHFWYPEPGGRDDHQQLAGHEKRVSALAMPSDGSYILTSSFDGTARVWPMQPQLLIRRACATVGRSPTDEEWKAWLPSRKYEAICG